MWVLTTVRGFTLPCESECFSTKEMRKKQYEKKEKQEGEKKGRKEKRKERNKKTEWQEYVTEA